MNANRGDIVRTWFDTGAMGAAILLGRVIKSGPRSFTVEWESGIRNRLRQGDRRVEPAGDLAGEFREPVTR